MTTGREIVTKALQKARVLTKYEAPSSDELSDGLEDLNNMVGSWANDTLMTFVRQSESFPVAAGTASYTIGPSATFNTVRPQTIVSAYVRIGGTDYPIDKIRDTRYDRQFYDKDTQGYPRELLYEAGSPTGTITLFPVPNTSGTIHIRSEKPLTAFTADGDVELPPGWERALIFNLALEIAPDFGVEPTAQVQKIAFDSKKAIKTNSARNRGWECPPLTSGVYSNVNSGPI